LLRPLPYSEPDRLVQLNETDANFGGTPGAVFNSDLREWRAHSTTVQEIATYGSTSKSLFDFAEPERIQTVRSERDLVHMLGVKAMIGRTYRDDDPPDVAVLSAGVWKRRFGADPSWIGRKITLDRQPFTILGVMPESFQFPYRAALVDL